MRTRVGRHGIRDAWAGPQGRRTREPRQVDPALRGAWARPSGLSDARTTPRSPRMVAPSNPGRSDTRPTSVFSHGLDSSPSSSNAKPTSVSSHGPASSPRPRDARTRPRSLRVSARGSFSERSPRRPRPPAHHGLPIGPPTSSGARPPAAFRRASDPRVQDRRRSHFPPSLPANLDDRFAVWPAMAHGPCVGLFGRVIPPSVPADLADPFRGTAVDGARPRHSSSLSGSIVDDGWGSWRGHRA